MTLSIALVLVSARVEAMTQDFQCYGTEYVGDQEAFRVSKINEIIKNGFSPGVFQHTGGGPNGSHWNLSGMREGMFCVAEVPANVNSIRSIHVKAGRADVPVQTKQEAIGKDRSVLSFSVPFTAIANAARKIKRADLLLLYGDHPEEIALYLRNGTWNKVAPPDLGEVIEISLAIQTKTGRNYSFSRMIHATSGE